MGALVGYEGAGHISLCYIHGRYLNEAKAFVEAHSHTFTDRIVDIQTIAVISPSGEHTTINSSYFSLTPFVQDNSSHTQENINYVALLLFTGCARLLVVESGGMMSVVHGMCDEVDGSILNSIKRIFEEQTGQPCPELFNFQCCLQEGKVAILRSCHSSVYRQGVLCR